MIRHLKNINELILYASISCGSGFLVRLIPSFLIPVLVSLLVALFYYWYVVGVAESNKLVATIITAALAVGFICGHADWLELYLRYNSVLIARYVSIISCLILVLLAMVGYVATTKK